MIQQTSQEAFSKMIPKLPESQFTVWSALRERAEGMTNAEISYHLQRPINTITPRTNELVRLGYVKEFGKRQCRITGSQAMVWVAIEELSQLRLF